MELEDDDHEEEREEGEEDDEEEITIPPPSQPKTYNYCSPLPPNHHEHHQSAPRKAGATTSTSSATAAARYRECLKNHAVSIGGHAVDGCGEFMPAGEDGALEALKCAACGCHRNFHRKESDVSSSSPAAANTRLYPQFTPSPYYRTPPPLPPPFQVAPPPMSAAAAASAHHHHYRPLALPSTSGGYGRGDDEMDEFSNPSSSGGGGGSTPVGGKIKRYRTKFTAEQKQRMLEFAEKVGWRIQKHDETAVHQFCEEVGVRRQVLKVWMHNNKHTLGRKP